MTSTPLPEPTRKPIVCTLSDKAMASQFLEWSDLAGLALSVEVLPDGMRSTYPSIHAEAIEDLVARERGCCGSWLDIDVARGDEELTLTLRTDNPDGLGVIRSMAGVNH